MVDMHEFSRTTSRQVARDPAWDAALQNASRIINKCRTQNGQLTAADRVGATDNAKAALDNMRRVLEQIARMYGGCIL